MRRNSRAGGSGGQCGELWRGSRFAWYIRLTTKQVGNLHKVYTAYVPTPRVVIRVNQPLLHVVSLPPLLYRSQHNARLWVGHDSP